MTAGEIFLDGLERYYFPVTLALIAGSFVLLLAAGLTLVPPWAGWMAAGFLVTSAPGFGTYLAHVVIGRRR
jgi:hypothetical protein